MGANLARGQNLIALAPPEYQPFGAVLVLVNGTMQVLGVEGHGWQRPEGTQEREGHDSGDVNEQAARHREAGLGIATGPPMHSRVYQPNRSCIHHLPPPPFTECLPNALIDHARCTR